MMAWLAENLGNIVVSLILIAVFTAVIVSMIRDKKNGKSSCGCDCAHCGCCGSCHKQ